jgi:hypothetical protein
VSEGVTPSTVYSNLDDIDSPSDWDDEENEVVKNAKPVKNAPEKDSISQQAVNIPAAPVSDNKGLLPTPKFLDIDINSHGVYVVDGGREDKEMGRASVPTSPDMDGFTIVESKKDKKDRDKKRKQQTEDQRRGGGGDDNNINRHKGPISKAVSSSSSSSTSVSRNSGWPSFGPKAPPSASNIQLEDNDGGTSNDNWGRSSRYGAIGEKPSRETTSDKVMSKVTSDNMPVSDYRLFDADNRPFPIKPKHSGQLLSEAIDSTYSGSFTSQVFNLIS